MSCHDFSSKRFTTFEGSRDPQSKNVDVLDLNIFVMWLVTGFRCSVGGRIDSKGEFQTVCSLTQEQISMALKVQIRNNRSWAAKPEKSDVFANCITISSLWC